MVSVTMLIPFRALPQCTGTKPMSDFNAPGKCQGNVTKFTDASVAEGSIAKWDWNFGNGKSATEQNPSVLFDTAGIYPVTLIVTSDSGCTDSVTKNVFIWANPQPDFEVSDICLGDTAFFTDKSTIPSGSIVSWLWLFGDSQTDSVASTNHVYGKYGEYNVVLVTESDSGCVNLKSKTIIVSDIPQASFSAKDDCFETPTVFTNLSKIDSGNISGYYWEFDDPTSLDSTSNDENPQHNFTAAGSYNVKLIATSDQGCADSTIQVVESYPKPSSDFSFNIVCFGDTTKFTDLSTIGNDSIVDWRWTFGDNDTSSTQNPMHVYASSGVFDVRLVTTSSNICSDTVNQTVEVKPLPIVNFAVEPACLNTETQFTDSSSITSDSITEWQWSIDKNTIPDKNPVYTFTVLGTYNVKLVATSEFGCVDSTEKIIEVHEVPVPGFIADTSGCMPFTTEFNDLSYVVGDSIVSWNWHLGDTLINDTNITFTYDTSGSFDVTLTVESSSGCVDSLVQKGYIKVRPLPTAGFIATPNATYLIKAFIEFSDTSAGATDWLWKFGDSTTADFKSGMHFYTDTGTFKVEQIAITEYGCTDTAAQNVYIFPQLEFYIPSSFSPNQDNLNETFMGIGTGITDYEMWIFNRSGGLIYHVHEDNIDNVVPWDGTNYLSKNTTHDLGQEGLYVYKFRLIDKYFQSYEFLGTVYLIR